jgi:serine/threonine-protein kinase
MNSVNRIGKFEVVEPLGRGAMGQVFRCWDPSLQRSVAIKVMTAHLDVDPELRARFFREAQAAGSLQHPNIITVFELGQAEGRPYIVMEYVPGRDLDAIIEARQPLRISEKVELIEQVCRGLAYAHERQIVHRDVKPANIRVTETGQVKIMDFGVAYLVSSELTQTGSLIGTPYYMAPEVINGEPVDGRADIFSLGATFYELLAYVRPFPGESMQTVFRNILHVDPPPLRDLGLDVPVLLQKIIGRCLAKRAADRYGSMGDVLSDLMLFWESLPGGSKVRAAATTSLGVAVTRAARGARRQARLRRMMPVAAGGAAAAALLLVVGSSLLDRFGVVPAGGAEELEDQTTLAQESAAGPGPGAGAADSAGLSGATGEGVPPEPAEVERPAQSAAAAAQRESPAERSAPRSDAARRAYESAREDALQVRDRALESSAPQLAGAPYRRAETMLQSAEAAAAAARYEQAAQDMRGARSAFESAALTAVFWRARLDSAWSVLTSRAAQADRQAPSYDRAEQLRVEAERAQRAATPELALAHIAAAIELYREATRGVVAAQAAPPPGEELPRRAEPPAAPAPAPASEPTPQEIVDRTLAKLRVAIESEDLAALRGVWVGLTSEEIRRFESSFDVMRDLAVDFRILSLDDAAERIVVEIETTYDFLNTSTRRRERQSFRQHLEIGRRDGDWVVLRSR